MLLQIERTIKKAIERIDSNGAERLFKLDKKVSEIEKRIKRMGHNDAIIIKELREDIWNLQERIKRVDDNREYMKQHKQIIEEILDEMGKDWEYVEGYRLKEQVKEQE